MSARRCLLLAAAAVVFALAGICMSVIDPRLAAARHSCDYVIEHGARQTGAVNLVTAIYLGYRSFDTLCETVVLFLAVSGTAFFFWKRT